MTLEVKICGLKTPETLEAALKGGASHVGFVFFAPSPRDIGPSEATVLRQRAEGRAKVVAVTVDADDALLDEIARGVRPDLLQLHGHETPERAAAIKRRWGIPVIKAFSVLEAGDLAAAAPFEGIAECFLFDAKAPKGAKLPGGNGARFDWTVLAGFRTGTPWFLSGGLHPGNVSEAVRTAQPTGVDVSSGVELVPGRKDIGLIQTFLSAARAAGRSRAA